MPSELFGKIDFQSSKGFVVTMLLLILHNERDLESAIAFCNKTSSPLAMVSFPSKPFSFQIMISCRLSWHRCTFFLFKTAYSCSLGSPNPIVGNDVRSCFYNHTLPTTIIKPRAAECNCPTVTASFQEPRSPHRW
jgi:hypothetical protein